MEKHFTLDRSSPGPDHRTSLEPAELREYIIRVNAGKSVLGREGVIDDENSRFLKKQMVATRDIDAGDILEVSDLVAMRTGLQGFAADQFIEMVGRQVRQRIEKGHVIREGLLK